MRKFLFAAAVLAILGLVAYEQSAQRSAGDDTPAVESQSALLNAIASHASGVQVESQALVAKVLPDDNSGSRHQRFIVSLPSGQTVLIAHNTDIAQRIPSLTEGKRVSFSGEYEWSSKGGVVHWTHRDPQGRHKAGWVRYEGRLYQ